MESNQEILDNTVEIYDNMNVESITPYMPSNGTEGSLFEARWCRQCVKDFTDDCEILSKAFCGDQPTEWIEFDNKPICTAFKKRTD